MYSTVLCCTVQVTFYTFYLKGVADHIGVWDTDEFFIPRGENQNLLDVIDNSYSPFPEHLNQSYATSHRRDPHLWPGGKGWAIDDGHPFCGIRLQ